METTQGALEAIKILQTTAASTTVMIFFSVLVYIGIKLFFIQIVKKIKIAKTNKKIKNLEPKDIYKIIYDNNGIPTTLQLKNKIILI